MKSLLVRLVKVIGIALAIILVLGGSLFYVAARRSMIPDGINMSSSHMDGMNMDMGTMAMGTPGPNDTLLTSLVAEKSDTPVKTFTVTTQMAQVDLGNGITVNAYTYNGTLPGPELRVQQGDMVEVKLVNQLPVATTIHWHGISVPNAEDGVAGLTQDAVQPGQSYTYRFIAKEVGTYWYHSHQDTSEQLPGGLFGAIIVEPKKPTVKDNRDYTVFLHEWNAPTHDGLQGFTTCHASCSEILSINDRTDKVTFDAQAGETVRLRIVNSGEEIHHPVLVGAPFEVIALDGHDLNEPSSLTNTRLPIGPAQRYDIRFVMPASGSVALVDGDNRAEPADQHPMAIFGSGETTVHYPTDAATFDFTTYGKAAADPITLDSHFDQQIDMQLGNQLGFYNGNFTLTFPINGAAYPSIPSIQVQMGQLIKIHMTANGMFEIPHAMHLHGQYFTVLAHNDKPLSGSPVHLDTIYIDQGESYDVAFLADNPGLWMIHCHMVEHDARGMDMMLEYPNIYTPYEISTASGNNPF